MSTHEPETEPVADPHARMERAFIEEYLHERGYSLKELQDLPEALAHQLMIEASTYASSKLTEVEARAHFVDKVHDAMPRQ